MIIEEMLIKIRATVDGVKEGVSTTKKELRKLNEDKSLLELKIKAEAEGIQEIRKQIQSLQQEKSKLNEQLKLQLKAEGVTEAERKISLITKEIDKLEDSRLIAVDDSEIAVLDAKIKKLIEEKARLSDEVTVKMSSIQITETQEKVKTLENTISGLNTDIKIKANSPELKALNEELENTDNNIADIIDATKETEAAMGALALTGAAAFYSITKAISSSITAYNDKKNALTGLQSIVSGTGGSFSDAQKAIDDFTADGLIPAADAATGLKNLLARGFGLDEAVQMMNRFKDSAAFGRQGALSMGDAVRSATEGIKNENSVLVDNAGVTKNVSVMWKEYAELLGKSVNDLTVAEKRQAEFNGIMEETKHQVGDAAKAAEGLTGAQSAAAKATTDLSAAFGEALAPAVESANTLYASILKAVTEFIAENKTMVATITTAGLAISAYLVIVNAYTIAKEKAAEANIAFSASLGPIGIAITAVSAVVVGLVTSYKNAKTETENLKKATEDLNAALKNGVNAENYGNVDSAIGEYKEQRQALKDLADEYENLEEQKRKYGDSDEYFASQQQIVVQNMKKEIELAQKSGIEIDKTKSVFEQFSQVQEHYAVYGRFKPIRFTEGQTPCL